MEKVEIKLDVMIQKLCKEQGLTIAELSRRSGVPKQTIHNWTLKQTSINPIQVLYVAIILSVDIKTLLFNIPENLDVFRTTKTHYVP